MNDYAGTPFLVYENNYGCITLTAAFRDFDRARDFETMMQAKGRGKTYYIKNVKDGEE